MKNEILEELSSKYGKKKVMLKIMIDKGLELGYNQREINKIIKEFYSI